MRWGRVARSWLVERGLAVEWQARVDALVAGGMKEEEARQSALDALREGAPKERGRGGRPRKEPVKAAAADASLPRSCPWSEGVEWVASNLSPERVAEVGYGDRPSDEAWALFSWAKSSEQAQRDFFLNIYGKLAPAKAEMQMKSELERSMQADVEMVERIAKATERAVAEGRRMHPWL